jgi:hypothetical protein
MGERVVRRGVEIQASRYSGAVRHTRVGIVCATASCAASRWPPSGATDSQPPGRSGLPSRAHGRTPRVACSPARRRCGTSRHATCRDHSVIARPGGLGMSRPALMWSASAATSSRWRLTARSDAFSARTGFVQPRRDHAGPTVIRNRRHPGSSPRRSGWWAHGCGALNADAAAATRSRRGNRSPRASAANSSALTPPSTTSRTIGGPLPGSGAAERRERKTFAQADV